MTAASGADRDGNWTCPGCGKWAFQVIHSCPRPHGPLRPASGADGCPVTGTCARTDCTPTWCHLAAGTASGADQPTLRDQLEATAHASIQQASWQRGVAMLDSDVTAFHQRLLDDLLPLIEADRERAKAEGGAEALEQCYREDRTTVAKLGPIEQLTCFVVKTEDMVTRAAALRAGSGQQ